MTPCSPVPATLAVTLPGEEPGSPTQGLVVLEMDDVMEGGGEQHEAIMTDIASRITFGTNKGSETVRRGCSVQREAMVSGHEALGCHVPSHRLHSEQDRTSQHGQIQKAESEPTPVEHPGGSYRGTSMVLQDHITIGNSMA